MQGEKVFIFCAVVKTFRRKADGVRLYTCVWRKPNRLLKRYSSYPLTRGRFHTILSHPTPGKLPASEKDIEAPSPLRGGGLTNLASPQATRWGWGDKRQHPYFPAEENMDTFSLLSRRSHSPRRPSCFPLFAPARTQCSGEASGAKRRRRPLRGRAASLRDAGFAPANPRAARTPLLVSTSPALFTKLKYVAEGDTLNSNI